MARLRFYQLSLRRLFLLTAVVAGCLWVALWWLGRMTPQQGETLVPLEEQRVLHSITAEFALNYAERPAFS